MSTDGNCAAGMLPAVTRHFESATSEMLAAILDQSMDCIKVIGPDGRLDFMNRNGRCAMEIDDFALVAGRHWWDLWPEESRHLIKDAVERVCAGENRRFEAFCPTAKGTPRWWEVSVSSLRDPKGDLQGLVSVSRDITDRVKSRELREAAAAEMRHRLQNAYTLTGAIISTLAKGTSEREQFAGEILERLQRLGIAQSLLLENATGSTELAQLTRRLIEPFCPPHCDLRFGDLPELLLGEDDVRALALTLAELCTNSNKYGALGNGGSLAVDGEVAEGMLRLHWTERCPMRSGELGKGGGNGHRLVRRALSSRGGDIQVYWLSDGLDIAISLPARS